jgi:radical SAM protein with 4Fe4S-binding SPASM domain
MTITPNSYIGFHPKSYFKRIQLDGKFVGDLQIYDFDFSKQIHINPDAYEILELLDKGDTVGDTARQLAKSYDMEPEEMEETIIPIIQKFVDEGVANVLSTPSTHLGLIPGVLDFPYDYFINAFSSELLSGCNLKCRHCYGSFDSSDNHIIAKEKAIDILDQLRELHCSDISFTGGEVLLHPDFLDILRHAQKHNFKTSFLTNGTLLTQEIVQELKQIGYFEIQISLDADNPEVHDAFRGVPGAFDKAFAGLRMLRDAGFTLAIAFVLNQTNKQCLEAMDKVAKEFDAHLKVGPLLRYGNGAVNADPLYIDHQHFYEIFHDIHKRNPAVEMEHANRELEVEDKVTEKPDYIPRCAAGKGKIALKANGDIIPCEILPDRDIFRMGNIYQNTIRDISIAYDRDALIGDLNALSLDQCSDCSHVATCKAGCFAASLAEYDKIDILDPFTCIRTKVTNNEPWP